MYIPLHVHSDASLLDAMSSPNDIAKRITELDLPACAITDHGSLTNCIKFYNAMKQHNKKFILGIEAYICLDDPTIHDINNRKLYHQVILAKDLEGWRKLIRIVSTSNEPANFYYRPRLDLPTLVDFTHDGHLISFSGHLGSLLAHSLQEYDYNIEEACQTAYTLESMFGKGNFYIEIQLIDKANNPECLKIAEALREVSNKTKIPCVATCDAHYCNKSDVHDHRVLLCTNMKTTFAKIASSKSVGLDAFFKSDCFYIPSYEEMLQLHSGHEDELKNTIEIAEKCEDYNVLSKPKLPKYECPDGYDENKYFRQLCRDGWKEKQISNTDTKYIDRIKYELNTLQSAGLSSYFLMVIDIAKYVKSHGWICSNGRGSVGGCLVAYLTDITTIDPIKHNLIFERFYNQGRNTADKVALPDIDLDVPASKRDNVIQYIKQKYGQSNVAQIATFGAMKGRSALKDVLRAYSAVSVDEMNEITSCIQDEAKITDELQDMKKELGTSSIIRWSLQHRAKKLKQWCYIDDKKRFQGPLARMFEQAIRLEKTLAIQGKHPAGIIISPEPLNEICPMIYDAKTHKQIVGWEMNDAESVGLVKMDILGLSLLDKMMGVKNVLATGKIYESTI